jgi:hypothetical protein
VRLWAVSEGFWNGCPTGPDACIVSTVKMSASNYTQRVQQDNFWTLVNTVCRGLGQGGKDVARGISSQIEEQQVY